MASALKEPDIYQFKVTLKGILPLIWRRIQISKNATFETLHYAVNQSMGWKDSHVHEFRLKKVAIGPIERSCYIDAMCWDSFRPNKTILDESKKKISTIFRKPSNSMIYEYDFGDRWTHSLVLEEVLPSVKNRKYPVCLNGRRACPPDDCGGQNGYRELLIILADPTHEEHKEKKDWLAWIDMRDWNPEIFDAKKVKLTNSRKKW